MTSFTHHENGMPCWIDASVSDSSTRIKLIDFYSKLFGWTFEVGPAETGFYSMAYLNGNAVLAIGEQPGGEGRWVTYFATRDMDSSIKAVTENGGEVLFGPMKVMSQGSMALAMDPTGAIHGLWQPELFPGFGVAHEIGALGWLDHVSQDTSKAAIYYVALLGEEFSVHDEPPMSILRRGEEWFASFSKSETKEEIPQWTPVFVVASLDGAKTTVREMGGEIIAEEIPVPGSVISVVKEPVTGQLLTLMAAGQD